MGQVGHKDAPGADKKKCVKQYKFMLGQHSQCSVFPRREDKLKVA